MARFRDVRWAAVLVPAIAVALFEFTRHQLAHRILPAWLGHGWAGNLLSALVVAGVAYAFVRFFAGITERSAAEVAIVRQKAAIGVERQRIAREMHDSVAQALFYMAVKLGEVDNLLSAKGTGAARDELREAAVSLKDTYEQVQETITDLKEQADLENLGDALRRLARHAPDHFGLEVECRIDVELDLVELDLPARSLQHLFAVVEEALANARRHGKVQKASVVAKKAGADLIIEVSDEGTGFDPGSISHTARGNGLAIMAERARILGGELLVDSAPGRGTRIRVSVPEAGS